MGERSVVDAERGEAAGERVRVGRGQGGDAVADIAGDGRQDRLVRIRVAQEHAIEVGRGKDAEHAGHGERRRGVDAGDPGMRMGAAGHAGNDRAFGYEIGGVTGAAHYPVADGGSPDRLRHIHGNSDIALASC